jgi:hypothetical protein
MVMETLKLLPTLMEPMKSIFSNSSQPSLKMPKPAELHSLTALMVKVPSLLTAHMTPPDKSAIKMLSGNTIPSLISAGLDLNKSGTLTFSPSEVDLTKQFIYCFDNSRLYVIVELISVSYPHILMFVIFNYSSAVAIVFHLKYCTSKNTF